MIDHEFSGAAIAAVMPWTLHAVAPAAAARPAVAAHAAIPAIKRRTAAASVASVNRGTI